MIAEQIQTAMTTLRFMPGENTGRLKAVWPETLNTDRENWWAATNAENDTRLPPSPEDIARMDVVLFQWFPLLTAYERVLVSARGSGCSWRKIMGICHQHLARGKDAHKRNWRKAIKKLSRSKAAETLALTSLGY